MTTLEIYHGGIMLRSRSYLTARQAHRVAAWVAERYLRRHRHVWCLVIEGGDRRLAEAATYYPTCRTDGCRRLAIVHGLCSLCHQAAETKEAQ